MAKNEDQLRDDGNKGYADGDQGKSKELPDDRPPLSSIFYSKEENEAFRERNETYSDAHDKGTEHRKNS